MYVTVSPHKLVGRETHLCVHTETYSIMRAHILYIHTVTCYCNTTYSMETHKHTHTFSFFLSNTASQMGDSTMHM